MGKKKKRKEYIITGMLEKKKDGFGFIVQPEGAEEYVYEYPGGEKRDVYISRDDMNGAMDGDIVEAVILPQYFWRGTRPEGQVVRIRERKLIEVTGTMRKNGRYAFVIPEDPGIKEHIYIPAKNFGGAGSGDKVVCTITKYPEGSSSPEGKIKEIIAVNGEKGADIKALIRAFGYSREFPEDAAKEAAKLGGNTQDHIDPALLKDRRDLRDKMIMTIDGAGSKDFDDAVSVEKTDNGDFILGVHIADVSEYVREDSALDREAMKRGNSVYIIDQVVPMLPEELSNGICSLNPGVDRLTLSVEMKIDRKGNIKDYEIYKSVIRSKYRAVYDDISDIIEYPGSCSGYEKDRRFLDTIMDMAQLADILAENKKERGSLDFNSAESSIGLDKKGRAISVEPYPARSANRMIEEFMIAANETVAKHFAYMELPFIYRVHEKPSSVKLSELRAFLRGIGISLSLNADSIHPKALSEILEKVHGEQYENVVNTVMLRSMQKAYYATECKGHFGLSLRYYCHFTSPIRRYPDLMIHRIIKRYLTGFPTENDIKKYEIKMEEAAANSSVTERKAVEAERSAEKMKKAEYMESHIGEEYPAVISGVSNYGIYAELENTVEGLIRLEWLNDDYYECEAEKYRVVGRQTGRVYMVGQSVNIKVRSADKEKREIDFTLVCEDRNKDRKSGQ